MKLNHLIYFLLIIFSCTSAENQGIMSEETASAQEINNIGFIHTVFFWMKEDISQDEIRKVGKRSVNLFILLGQTGRNCS